MSTKVLMKLRIYSFDYLGERTQLSLHAYRTRAAPKIFSLFSKQKQESKFYTKKAYIKCSNHVRNERKKISQKNKKQIKGV